MRSRDHPVCSAMYRRDRRLWLCMSYDMFQFTDAFLTHYRRGVVAFQYERIIKILDTSVCYVILNIPMTRERRLMIWAYPKEPFLWQL